MQLKSVDDRRDNISKAKKRQLVEFARANGMTEIHEGMPADDIPDADGNMQPGIRSLLRQRGLTRIPIPTMPLGSAGRHETRPLVPKAPPAPAPSAPPPVGIDEWAEFQRWKASREAAPPQPQARPERLVPRPVSEINRLRDECKRLGIKMDRRDNKDALKAKIEAHGQQNASTSLQ